METLHKDSTTSNSKIEKPKISICRFNDTLEQEICQRTLPDLLKSDLDIIIIGINPGLASAYKGHHYASPTNHFWKCLNLSALTPQPMTAEDDFKLLEYGIGFTNVVERTTRSSASLSKQEIKEGCKVLLEKLQILKPKIAVFNGKLIYEIFSSKRDFNFGIQPEFIKGTNIYIWVMPSSSARSAHLPSPLDKLPFYQSLKKFRDSLNSELKTLCMEEYPMKTIISTVSNEKEVKSIYFNSLTSQRKGLEDKLFSTKRKCKLEKNTKEEMETNLKFLRTICQRKHLK